MQLAGVARRDRVDPALELGLQAEVRAHEIRAGTLHGVERPLPLRTAVDRDRVRIPARSAVDRSEVRVAHEPQRSVGAEPGDHVGAGGRHRPAREEAHAGGNRDGVGQRQLVEEVRVGRGQAERDRAGGVVDPDAGGQVAGRPPSQAAPGPANPVVVHGVPRFARRTRSRPRRMSEAWTAAPVE